MNTTTTAPKTAAVSILLNRAEGLTVECGEILLAARHEVSPWQRAAALVTAWQAAKQLRGDKHADKVDYTITYANGDTATGTYEMDLTNTLVDHILREHRFWTGDHCPAHLTAEKYAHLIATMVTPAKQQAHRDFLTGHEIG